MKHVHDYLNQHIQDQSIIGMGSGSTIEAYIPAVATYISENDFDVTFVPTSERTEKILIEYGMTTSLDIEKIDLTIDGADYFTPSLIAIKGYGGALVREKQIGYISKDIIIVARENKQTDSFEDLKIPVEINPFLFELTKIQIEEITEAKITDRSDGDALFITDNGNYIADCRFESILDISSLHNTLINIPGVIETGIFDRYINQIVSFGETDFTVYKN
ncbi:ribose 5-phosphate isomerase A [Salinicoccus sp. YB14-2]|uniref:ribose 5-phosphate isomerase A n=1 Tax=Salinicoccus sp. YB14-2 TaxID=1572701 RepID=UPI00069097B9|nr:ribose 5-phosphate isomerase A [Salinicoccus sp. YB14-2]